MPSKGLVAKLLATDVVQHGVQKAAGLLDKLVVHPASSNPTPAQSATHNNSSAPPPPPHPHQSHSLSPHPHPPHPHQSHSLSPHPHPPHPHPPQPHPSNSHPSQPQRPPPAHPSGTPPPHYQPQPSYAPPPPPPPPLHYPQSPPQHDHPSPSMCTLQSHHAYPPSHNPLASAPTPSLYPSAPSPSPSPYQTVTHPYVPPSSQQPPLPCHPQQTAVQPHLHQQPPPAHPQPSHSQYSVARPHIPHSYSATFSHQKPFPYASARPDVPSASAPHLSSPACPPQHHSPSARPQNRPDPAHPYRPHAFSSTATPYSAHHSPSHPQSHHGTVQHTPTASSHATSHTPPSGYPCVHSEPDNDSYHTASAPPQSPFALPPSSNQHASPAHAPAPSAPDHHSPPSPSDAPSGQMSCAAFNIVPVRIQPPSETSELLMEDLLEETHKRERSVVDKLGRLVFDDACRGLSRVLDPADGDDVQMFGIQLRRTDYAACEQDLRRCGRDNIPTFAISYAHPERQVGRYAFSDRQWENFEAAMRLLAKSNVGKVRVWFDQCLWLRDSNLGCWAHTGLIPYVTWPVISLGVKVPGKDRTHDSYERVWPYLEEVGGLWSMGVITTSELHQEDEDETPACVTYIRYNHRVCLDPQISLYLLFHSICEGKISEHTCGSKEDFHELMDLAHSNMDRELDHVVVGSNWRARISQVEAQSRPKRFRDAHSSLKGQFTSSVASGTVYMDG